MLTNRKGWIDIIKGLCIILVVMGHTRSPFNKYIYLFHVPVFFVLSGYLLKKSDGNFNTFYSVVKHRIKRLYFPYVFWNIMFVLLHNYFIQIKFYNTDNHLKGIVGGNTIL